MSDFESPSSYTDKDKVKANEGDHGTDPVGVSELFEQTTKLTKDYAKFPADTGPKGGKWPPTNADPFPLIEAEDRRFMVDDPETDEKFKGKKFDKDKPRTDLLSPESLVATAEVLGFGAAKYGDRNWEEGMEWSRLYGAALRHLFAFWNGEDIDPESGLPHIDHAACCIHFLQHYYLNEDYAEGDDRPFLSRHTR